MSRKFKCGTKARLRFSGGPHAPVNMADSMENAGSWTVSGSKETMEVPKHFKYLLKLGMYYIVQYNTTNMPFPAFSHQHSLLPYYLPCLQECVAHQRS